MDVIEQYRTFRSLGRTRNEALAQLHRTGASPISCIRALCEVERVGLAQAKQIFAESPSWADYVRLNDESLIAELLRALEDDRDSGRNL